MAYYRPLAYTFIILISLVACNTKKPSGGNSRYDLLTPYKMKLPEGLAEISGIVYYPSDTSVFAIEDERGVLYKISLNRDKEIKKWYFNKRSDFEDLVLHDSVFYVLISNGDIESLRFNADGTIIKERFVFPDDGKKKNEFESLYYDDSLQQLVLLCKDCAGDNKKKVSAWGYNINTRSYSPSVLTIDMQPVTRQLGEQKAQVKPSAAAINPVTNELYILASINQLLIVTDRKGKFKEVFKLDEAIYKQPEGIAFTPAGDMIISNEWYETGLPNILIIKNKLKGL